MTADSRTIWCGNLSNKVTEELLYELFIQVAPLERVHRPVDKEGRKATYAFINVKHDVSVDYAICLLDGLMLYDRRIAVKRRMHQNSNPMTRSLENLVIPQHLMAIQNDIIKFGKSISDTSKSKSYSRKGSAILKHNDSNKRSNQKRNSPHWKAKTHYPVNSRDRRDNPY